MGIVLAPLSGTVLAMDQVPDPVFSSLMLGQGWAIDPFPGGLTVLSPVAGTVVALHPHAVVVEGEGGFQILMHLGIDTVKLNGEGFTSLIHVGQALSPGQPLCLWNTGVAERAGYSLVSPLVVMGAGSVSLAEDYREASTDVSRPLRVEAGKPLFTIS